MGNVQPPQGLTNIRSVKRQRSLRQLPRQKGQTLSKTPHRWMQRLVCVSSFPVQTVWVPVAWIGHKYLIATSQIVSDLQSAAIVPRRCLGKRHALDTTWMTLMTKHDDSGSQLCSIAIGGNGLSLGSREVHSHFHADISIHMTQDLAALHQILRIQTHSSIHERTGSEAANNLVMNACKNAKLFPSVRPLGYPISYDIYDFDILWPILRWKVWPFGSALWRTAAAWRPLPDLGVGEKGWKQWKTFLKWCEMSDHFKNQTNQISKNHWKTSEIKTKIAFWSFWSFPKLPRQTKVVAPVAVGRCQVGPQEIFVLTI